MYVLHANEWQTYFKKLEEGAVNRAASDSADEKASDCRQKPQRLCKADLQCSPGD